ncbi:MAG: hypothetical protein DHS80DRAFT_29950 [Piptocephalis tieghemiana]|nr:MAG: hypothetical protein DHS80DRAFT_29950 [Piptocephalis tieghemiana]
MTLTHATHSPQAKGLHSLNHPVMLGGYMLEEPDSHHVGPTWLKDRLEEARMQFGQASFSEDVCLSLLLCLLTTRPTGAPTNALLLAEEPKYSPVLALQVANMGETLFGRRTKRIQLGFLGQNPSPSTLKEAFFGSRPMDLTPSSPGRDSLSSRQPWQGREGMVRHGSLLSLRPGTSGTDGSSLVPSPNSHPQVQERPPGDLGLLLSLPDATWSASGSQGPEMSPDGSNTVKSTLGTPPYWPGSQSPGRRSTSRPPWIVLPKHMSSTASTPSTDSPSPTSSPRYPFPTQPSISTESNESDQAVTQTTGTHDTVSLPTMEEKTHPSRSVPSLIPTGRPTAYSDMALGGGRRGGRGVRRSITMDSLAATINSNISTSPSSTSFLPAPTTSEKEMSKGGEGGSLLVVEGLDRASSMVRAALMQLDTFFWSHVLDPEEGNRVEIIEEMRQEQRNMYLDPTLRAYCRDLVIALRAKDGVSGVTAKAGFDLLQGTLALAGAWRSQGARPDHVMGAIRPVLGHRVKQLITSSQREDRLDCIDQVIQEVPLPV